MRQRKILRLNIFPHMTSAFKKSSEWSGPCQRKSLSHRVKSVDPDAASLWQTNWSASVIGHRGDMAVPLSLLHYINITGKLQSQGRQKLIWVWTRLTTSWGLLMMASFRFQRQRWVPATAACLCSWVLWSENSSATTLTSGQMAQN